MKLGQRRLLGTFLGSRGGNFAAITGLMALPLVLTMGGAADFSMAYRGRAITQNALDAATLATARQLVFDATEEDLLTHAERFFDVNTRSLPPETTTIAFGGIVPPKEPGDPRILRMRATYTYDPVFLDLLSLLGNDDYADGLTMELASEVALRNDTIELALVLDNSGSMGEWEDGKRRIDVAEEAATDLVNSLFDLREMLGMPDTIDIGIVPFDTTVNVGTHYNGQHWFDTALIDSDGRSPIHHENFDWSELEDEGIERVERTIGGVETRRWKISEELRYYLKYTYNVDITSEWLTRQTFFRHAPSIGDWAGCLEARPEGYAATDTPPTMDDPNSLFVPYFAPDEYHGGVNDYLRDASSRNPETGAVPNLSAREKLKVQRNVEKYLQGGESNGPNAGCIDIALLPLSDDRGVIIDKLEEMRPVGNTNIPEGIAWGWRVLSASEPFTQGRAPDAENNVKILVVMSDGENNYGGSPNAINESIYGAYGFAKVYDEEGHARQGRIFQGTKRSGYNANTYKRALNDHMATLCQNIKNENILVATIAFATAQPSGETGDAANVADRLKACASFSTIKPDTKLFFYAADAQALRASFKELVLEISALRLAK